MSKTEMRRIKPWPLQGKRGYDQKHRWGCWPEQEVPFTLEFKEAGMLFAEMVTIEYMRLTKTHHVLSFLIRYE